MEHTEMLDLPATPRQLKFIVAIARQLGITEDNVSDETERIYGQSLGALSRRNASAFIDRLQARRNPPEIAS